MINIKRANPLNFASLMARDLVNNINAKICRYCTRRIIEIGLAPKTFAYEFKLDRAYTLSDCRKSLSKLKTLLIKYIIKVVPFTAFTSEEFISLENKDYININISSSQPTTELDMTKADEFRNQYAVTLNHYTLARNNTYRELYVNLTATNKWGVRYAGYLNYIFRKNFIPLYVSYITKMVFNQEEVIKVRDYYSSKEREAAIISYVITGKLQFTLATWSYNHPTNIIDANNIDSLDDSIFADDAFWSPNFRVNSSISSHFLESKFNIARLFLHLGTGLQILTTLSRKATYGSAAFSFKSN